MLKAKLVEYRESRAPPKKKMKTISRGPQPAYHLPPTWDHQQILTPEEGKRKRMDIMVYMRPLRWIPRAEPEPVPELAEEPVPDLGTLEQHMTEGEDESEDEIRA